MGNVTLEAVPIGVPDLRNVPTSLHRLASCLEDGSEPPSTHAIVVLVDEHGEIRIHGYGEVGNMAHEVGTLHMAALKLAITGSEA